MTFHFNEVCDCGREGQHPNAYLCKYELSIATAIASKTALFYSIWSFSHAAYLLLFHAIEPVLHHVVCDILQ